MASPISDARKLQRNARATTDELREFLGELRGKSPKEMLGEISNSTLARSTLTASAGAATLILAFTALPFAWSKVASPPQGKTNESAPLVPRGEEAESTAPTPAQNVPPPEASKALGIGEELEAPATVNPLDSTNTDLLEGLE